MPQVSDSPSFSEYRTVSEAAAYLGVSAATLRNWDRSGKLTPRRHPQNGYRIYLHQDLEALLRSVGSATATDDSSAPRVDWSAMGESEHFVQFYEHDDFLIESVSGFIGAALVPGDAAVVVATEPHRNDLRMRLAAAGVDVAEAEASGRFVMLDAVETLSKFMVDGHLDAGRFVMTAGPMMARLTAGRRRTHAFGEMVALLWTAGNREAAIRLEQLWNELAKAHRFALFCAYPIAEFADESEEDSFNGICSCHSRVIPAESYASIPTADERLRAITQLQQKAQSLEAEIVHRKQMEKSLGARERELADFFENATEGLHKVGPDGTILWANRAECELLGYSIEEYLGRPISDFHADAEVIETILRRLNAGETLENVPARLRRKDGSIRHVLINSSACLEDGKLLYTRCFTRDVTPWWHAEESLREADRRKDEFLAMLAHELRNPLAPIQNALELLRSGVELNDEVRAILDRQVRQMVRLVDDLLDVSRIARDKIVLRTERVELAAAVKTAVETSRPAIDALQHRLNVVLPSPPVYLDADPARLMQIFSNLLNNSAKYTERGGRIDLAAEVEGGEVVVTVRDNGVGIARDALPYVFDMFRQVDRSLERAQGGLGIGLTLVRRLVELHGGAITAKSEGHGQGSEFIVRLPVSTSGPSRSEILGPTALLPAANRRILVVDDNRDSSTTLSALLRSRGHEVHTATNGLEAIDLAARFAPEIILMDVGMPKLNGYDATRRIRRLPGGKSIFIIALTGWGQEGDVQRSVDSGCSAHLVKPVDFALLERLLASCPAAGR